MQATKVRPTTNLPPELLIYKNFIQKLKKLRRGDIVKALKTIPEASVQTGDIGVVFAEITEGGPLVRWIWSGRASRIVPSQIKKVNESDDCKTY